MGKKILFLDLDGTLLNDEREISAGNLAALKEALAQGNRVVINTGRPLESAVQQNKKLGLTMEGCYVISFNGGMVYDPYREQVIYRQCLPKETAIEVAKLVDSMNLHIQTYDDHYILVEPRWEDEAVRKYCNKIHMEYRVKESFATDLVDDPAKLLAISYTDRASMDHLEQVIKATFPQVECFFSCKEFLEIVPRGVHKGNALVRLCDQLGIPVEDSIAAGDEANDMAMLKAAGVGCAMKNAVPAVKEIADYITENDNNHDGVAEIVRKFMLN